jgi:predicted HD phosphohydrolase
MDRSRIRRQIAWEAARLMFDRRESEYYRAKMKAARHVCKGRVKPADLPGNAEIRDEVQNLSRMFDGDLEVSRKLRDMRIAALHMMTLLADYRPRLIGSVLTGHIRRGSDIDLHLFVDNLAAVTGVLDQSRYRYETQRKEITKHGETNVYRHVHVQDEFPFELTVYPANKAHYVFKSSITGKPIERANIAELRLLLQNQYPDLDLENELAGAASRVDPLQVFYALMLPLENVLQNSRYHPEGDALYHSLQVFDLACDQLPYDEEFLTAALLHDVGKAIDPQDHVVAAVEALEGLVSGRTMWLIENHMEAHKLIERTIGTRARRRLESHESFGELILLGECDRAGRKRGVETSELEEALDYLRELSAYRF